MIKSGKANMSDLFKNGDNFEFEKIDYNSKKIIKELGCVEKIQRNIRKSGDIDLNELRKIVFRV